MVLYLPNDFRQSHTAEVAGSNPVPPTTIKERPSQKRVFCFHVFQEQAPACGPGLKLSFSFLSRQGQTQFDGLVDFTHSLIAQAAKTSLQPFIQFCGYALPSLLCSTKEISPDCKSAASVLCCRVVPSDRHWPTLLIEVAMD